MTKPTVLFLDDQLKGERQRPSVQRYLECLAPRVELLEAADIDTLYNFLKEFSTNNKPIHGFLIDLMLPHCSPNVTFVKWGRSSLNLSHPIGGAQVIQLLRHAKYHAKRSDPNHPLAVANSFNQTSIVLFTTFEAGEGVAKKQEIETFCQFLYKDRPDIETQLLNWVATLTGAGV